MTFLDPTRGDLQTPDQAALLHAASAWMERWLSGRGLAMDHRLLLPLRGDGAVTGMAGTVRPINRPGRTEIGRAHV